MTISTVTRETAFRSEALQRAAVTRIARIARSGLGLFGVVDNHVHLLPVMARALAGRLAQRINCSLARLVGMRFGEAGFEPVRDRRHLLTLVRYFLRQPRHHNLPYHPALWAGSCFQDLIGARWLPELQLQLHRELPRLQPATLLEHVGLGRMRLEQVGPAVLARVGLERIASAAASAVALPHAIEGKTPRALLARRVTVLLASEARFRRAEIVSRLGWPSRCISRDRDRRPDPRAVEATRARLALEEAVRAREGE